MYTAIITKITNIRPHLNADKLKLGTASGYQVIVDITQEEELGVFFPTDGKLSHEMLLNNNLYRKHPETGEPMGGFFEVNGRVKTQTFRGEKSEGFWLPIRSLEWTEVDFKSLKDGLEFTTLNGKLVCEKYYTPKTLKVMNQNKGKNGQNKHNFPYFYKHYDTPHLQKCLHTFHEGDVLSFTEKLHGTSGITSHTNKVKPKKWWNLFIPQKLVWKYVTGSRNRIVNVNINEHSYKTNIRTVIHDHIRKACLHKGETLYYEIVGFDNTKPIMGIQKVTDKELVPVYGTQMVYTYGCSLTNTPVNMYVYRITSTNIDGNVVEYMPQQVENRCSHLGINMVPWIKKPFVFNGNTMELLTMCEEAVKGSSLLDPSHIKEGVVVRNHTTNKAYKYKNFVFLGLEGHQKDDKDFVDIEEVN